jgi:acetylcholinesterase
VDRSLALGEPVIYVSANYRVNGMQKNILANLRLIHYLVAFGFLSGKEVKERGLTNVGMHDRKSGFPNQLIH